jgi:hypothetical protein
MVGEQNQIVRDIISIFQVFLLYLYNSYTYLTKYFEKYDEIRW